MKEAIDVIKHLDLKPLPEEGGYYRETYRDNAVKLSAKSYGIESESPRSICTGIYYLVVPESFSALPGLRTDTCPHHRRPVRARGQQLRTIYVVPGRSLQAVGS